MQLAKTCRMQVFTLFRLRVLRLTLLTACLLGTPLLCFGEETLTVNSPRGLVLDATGALLIADSGNHRLLRRELSGELVVFAGTGRAGFGGDGSSALNADFNTTMGLAIEGEGNIFVSDSSNHRIRRIDGRSRVISTVAGTGTAGFSGDGGLATRAELNQPESVTVDASGNLFIADTMNDRIRRIDANTGVITTVAGGNEGGLNENSFMDLLKFAVGEPLGDGGKATKAVLSQPTDVEVDDKGNLFIADRGHSRIRRIDGKKKRIKTLVATGNFVASLRESASNRAAGAPIKLGLTSKGEILIVSSFDEIQRFDPKSKRVKVVVQNDTGQWQIRSLKLN